MGFVTFHGRAPYFPAQGELLTAKASLQYADSALSALYTPKSEHSTRLQQGWNRRTFLIPPPAERWGGKAAREATAKVGG
jgi:hypothetical protein